MKAKKILSWRITIISGMAGLVIGVVLLHPAAMFIGEYYGENPHLHWKALSMAFSKQHFVMTVFFGIIGIVIGVLFGILNTKLAHLAQRMRLLEDILPICSVCKRIRDEKSEPVRWVDVIDYITTQMDTQFTHSYCPDCAEKVFKEMEKLKKLS